MRWLLGAVALSATGCLFSPGGDDAPPPCTAGDSCSTDPRGVEFIGRSTTDMPGAGPIATAVSGTQALQLFDGDGTGNAFDLPFAAVVSGPNLAVDNVAGPMVTMRGLGAGSGDLAILNPPDRAPYGDDTLTSEPIFAAAFVPAGREMVPPGMDLAFATSNELFVVALTDEAGERLIDDSMQLSLAGSDRVSWDAFEIPNSTPGSYPLVVTPGDGVAHDLDLEIVDHVDAIAVQPGTPDRIYANGEATICFTATAAGRYVVGVDWTFTTASARTGPRTTARSC